MALDKVYAGLAVPNFARRHLPHHLNVLSPKSGHSFGLLSLSWLLLQLSTLSARHSILSSALTAALLHTATLSGFLPSSAVPPCLGRRGSVRIHSRQHVLLASLIAAQHLHLPTTRPQSGLC